TRSLKCTRLPFQMLPDIGVVCTKLAVTLSAQPPTEVCRQPHLPPQEKAVWAVPRGRLDRGVICHDVSRNKGWPISMVGCKRLCEHGIQSAMPAFDLAIHTSAVRGGTQFMYPSCLAKLLE